MTAQNQAIIVDEFTPVTRNTLRGFCKVILPSGMVLSDVSIHLDSGKAWASPASKPMLDRDGNVLRDPGGKIRYSPIVGFASTAIQNPIQ